MNSPVTSALGPTLAPSKRTLLQSVISEIQLAPDATAPAMKPIQLSIIIPTRTDAGALGRTLDCLTALSGTVAVEIIVAASGDPEGTEQAVAGRARLIWPAGSTRSALMNAGAGIAGGQALLFLHADSLPPPNVAVLIAAVLADDRVVGGAFAHRFAEPDVSLRLISWIDRIRYRLTRNYYGDQGIFVRTAVFRRMGGYRHLQLLEDLDFSQRLRRMGRGVLIRTPLPTSGRRFLARGPWWTLFFIVWILLCRTLRFDTECYATRWRGPADRPPGSPWPRGRPDKETVRSVAKGRVSAS